MTKTNIKIFKEITLSEKFDIEKVNQHLSIAKNEIIHSLKKVITKNIDKIIYAFARNLIRKDERPLAKKLKECLSKYRDGEKGYLTYNIKETNYFPLNPKTPTLFDEFFSVKTKVLMSHDSKEYYYFDIVTSVVLGINGKLQLNHEVSIDDVISDFIYKDNVTQNIVKKLTKEVEYDVKKYCNLNLTYFFSLYWLYVKTYAHDKINTGNGVDSKYIAQKFHGGIPLPNQVKNILSLGSIFLYLDGVNVLPVLEEASVLEDIPNLSEEINNISFNKRPAIVNDVHLLGALYREINSLISTNNNGIYLYIPNFIYQITQERHKARITYLDFNPDINTINRLHLTYLSYNSLDEISEVSDNKGKLYNVSIGNESSLAEINRFVNKGSEVYQITAIPKTVKEVSL